jgi:hypothetical protein
MGRKRIHLTSPLVWQCRCTTDRRYSSHGVVMYVHAAIIQTNYTWGWMRVAWRQWPELATSTLFPMLAWLRMAQRYPKFHRRYHQKQISANRPSARGTITRMLLFRTYTKVNHKQLHSICSNWYKKKNSFETREPHELGWRHGPAHVSIFTCICLW